MPHLTETEMQYVRYVLEGIPILSFNRDAGTFDVSEDVTSPSWEQVKLLGVATRRMSHRRPPTSSFFSVRLQDIRTGYYDRCLEHYCYERLELELPHEQTCWFRFASKTHCLGRIDPRQEFDEDAKADFMERLAHERSGDYVAMSVYREYCRRPELVQALKMDEDGWVLVWADVPIGSLDARKRLVMSVKGLAKRVLRQPEGDRVLRLVRSIEAHGWSNDLAWAEPEGGAVLGYSRTAKRHFAITGRHRLAAAMYLHSRGRLRGSTLLEFPVLTYRWESWRQGRPHPDVPVCEWCK